MEGSQDRLGTSCLVRKAKLPITCCPKRVLRPRGNGLWLFSKVAIFTVDQADGESEIRSKWMLLKRGMGDAEWEMGNGEWGMGNEK